MAVCAEHTVPGWCATLRLGFRKSPGRTELAERFRHGPLAVQRALYPEGDLCHIYLLHPPGGVAGGDHLEISAAVTTGAAALVTTPGATKFYRSAGPAARQHQTLEISGGSLEWLPQENILFPGADAELSTRVDLHENGAFIGWEINCLGRPAIDERFDRGRASFRFDLNRGGRPLLSERLVIAEEKALRSPVGLRGNPVFATLYATPVEKDLLETLREQIPVEHRHQLGVTQIEGLLIARYLGDSTATARRLLQLIWSLLRPAVVQRPACPPRIWNT